MYRRDNHVEEFMSFAVTVFVKVASCFRMLISFSLRVAISSPFSSVCDAIMSMIVSVSDSVRTSAALGTS